MPKICAVPGCGTGHYKDLTNRKKLGLRPRTLFKTPKCNGRLKQWIDILGCSLNEKSFICELHFLTNNINKSDKTILPDGTVHEIPRIHWSLDKDARPLQPHFNSENIEYENHVVNKTSDILSSNVEESFDATEPVVQSVVYSSDLSPMDEMIDQRSIIVETLPVIERIEENTCPSDDAPLTAFTMDTLKDALSVESLPHSWALTPRYNGVVFTLLDSTDLCPRLHLEIAADLSLQIRTNTEAIIFLEETLLSITGLRSQLKKLAQLCICSGTGFESERRHRHCAGILNPEEQYKVQRRNMRCTLCRNLRKKLQERKKRLHNKTQYDGDRTRRLLKSSQRKILRLQRKTRKLLSHVADLRRQCAAVAKETFEANIATLPEVQKQAIRAFFNAAKAKNKPGRRYTLAWIYECLLMRIKNKRLYQHIRDHQILPIPCLETLNRYIQKISSSAYGFQSTIFECLKAKGSQMGASSKRGTLLIDEMKLSEAVSFNRQTLEINGFVDLGQYTPDDKKNTRADHALVFMFQPFQGSWGQALGCFLSKDAVTSAVLHKLILECVVLLNNAGFHVDVVTTDGAQWNRRVWSIFGIEDGKFHCEHPCDPAKKFSMVSDFPHLIKCFRNGFIRQNSFQTPDGIVKKAHWETLLQYETYMKPNLKVAYNLTPTHLNPAGFQKMRVNLAFELFSLPVRVAMELYRNQSTCPELHDSEATQKFAEKIDKLISAMMSRTPLDALRSSYNCPQRKAIIEFGEYLREWERMSNGKEMPISGSTIHGLKVTLGATLEIMDVLHEESNYNYLMTARLNQDALERFFGMMRGACGSHDHPDPQLFIQIFRLLCSYSLIKPPKGCNVEGTELLQVLMQTKDSLSIAKEPRLAWLQSIDGLLEKGNLDCAIQQDHDYEALSTSTCTLWSDSVQDHTYDVAHTTTEVQCYMAGYVVRKMTKQLKCQDCINALQSLDHRKGQQHEAMIDLMNQYGGLLRPSDSLLELTEQLESTVLDVAGKFGVKIDTLHTILKRVSEITQLPKVGCVEHQHETTRKVIDFYLIMRAHFLVKSYNNNNNETRLKTRKLRKHAKY